MFALTSQKKKMPLAFWIFIGLIIGIAAGLLLMNANLFGMTGVDFAKAYIQPWGTIFLNLLKFIVVPIVMFSIAAGVISMKDIHKLIRTKQVKRRYDANYFREMALFNAMPK